MSFFSWLRKLGFCFSAPRANRKQQRLAHKRQRRGLLFFEVLEDRTVPSAVSWTGGSGDWDTPTNWSTGKIPGPTDDVSISQASVISVSHVGAALESIHSLTTSATDTLSWSNGTLNIAAASASINGPVNLSGGTWSGAGNLTLGGLLTWTSGTMAGTGTTTANGGIAFSGTSATEILDARTLNNAGTATWTSTNNIQLNDVATFTNTSTGTFTASNSQTISIGGFGTSVFNNAGIFASTGTTTLNCVFNNSGTVNINGGTLFVAGGGKDTSSGAFNVAAAATLEFAGNNAIGSSITGTGSGAVLFAGGSNQVTGTYNVAGSTTVSGGTADFPNAVTNAGATVTISGGGTLDFHKNLTLSTLDLENGTLTGPSAVTVSTLLTWKNSGVMSGTGSTILSAAATLNLGGDGTTEILIARTFNNAGTANWLSGSSNLAYENTALFNNQSGAKFIVNCDAIIYNATGLTEQFNNAGTFTKIGGLNSTTFQAVLFNNTGTVNVNSGTLALQAGGTDSAGAFNVATGATLNFGGGNTNLMSSVTASGTGGVTFTGGITTVLGTFSVAGTTAITGGTADFETGVSLPKLTLSSATLTGTSTVTVTSLLTWNSNATMSGTGTTVLTSGATMNLGGDATDQFLVTRAFRNSGAVNWLAGSADFGMYSGSTFADLPGSSFTVNCDRQIFPSGAISQFVNQGTFTKSAGAGQTLVGLPFSNTGTVNVNSGTLTLAGGGQDPSGAFNVATGATLGLGGNTYLNSKVITSGTGGVAFSSTGVVDVVTTTFTVTGTTTISGSAIANFHHNVTLPTLDLENGILTGPTVITISTLLTWKNSGTMSGTGVTFVNTGATFNLGGDGSQEILDTRTLKNSGTANWLAGSGNLAVYNSANFNNLAGATLTVNCDQFIYSGSGATESFNNVGTFTKSGGAGTTTFQNVFFNNTGTVNINAGTLALSEGNDATGSFAVANGATLYIYAGYTYLNSAVTTTGTGAVTFGSGSTDVNSTFTVTGVTTISGGAAVNFHHNYSLPTLDFENGILTGTGTVTVTGLLTWKNGGVMGGTGSTVLASGATMNLGGDGTTEYLDTRTFLNLGTVNWLANSGNWAFGDAAVFTNNHLVTVNCDQFIYDYSGATSQFNNNGGSFTKAAGTGTTTFQGVQFNNAKTVNVNSGTLALAGGNDSAGAFNVASGNTLSFAAGVTTLASSLLGGGFVTFSNSSYTDVTGTYSLSGGTTVTTNATVNFESAVTNPGATVTISSGIANFLQNVSIRTLNLTGGTLTGPSTVTVTSHLVWNNFSYMTGTGTTVLATTATLTLGGDTTWQAMDARTFNAAGNSTWLANSGFFYIYDGATFNNQAGATFSANASGQQIIYSSGPIGAFNNAGTFNKAAGTATTTFNAVPLNNTGTVNIKGGTLAINISSTSSGIWNVSSGTTLNFSGAFDNLTAAGTSITGAGSVTVSGGETDFGGTYNITGATTISAGTASFTNGGSTKTFSNTGGNVIIGPGTTFGVTAGNYAQAGGNTYLNGGALSVASGFNVNIAQSTSLIGPGSITGNVSNAGNFYVGGGSVFVGVTAITGSYTQSSTGTLFVNIGGTTAGTQYDQLTVSGAASLAGTLTITLQYGFSPVAGTNFTIMTYASESGDFTTKNLGVLSSGTPGATSYVVTK